MAGTYNQLHEKLKHMKITVHTMNHDIKTKHEMIERLKQQQSEIANTVASETFQLNEITKKKEDIEKTMEEATVSFKQLEDAVSSILNMINNKC